MDKENRSAAGLRRSAMAERIRLREEWSALKETGDGQRPPPRRTHHNETKTNASGEAGVGEALRGVVALVEVGGGARALALRAALAALGASVAARWSPLVTHLVWAEGGCRATRARARALAARLVSPLWVEASAAGARRLPEAAFPAAARPSDLPSPRTLQALLKRADAEGVPLTALFPLAARPRRSRPADADTSTDATTDTSTVVANIEKRPLRAKLKPPALPVLLEDVLLEDSKEMDITVTPQGALRGESVSFVNTQPRGGGVGGGGGGGVAGPPRAAPAAPRSRRKLFTPRDHASGSDEPSEEECAGGGGAARGATRTAARDGGPNRALARAERLARRLARTARAPHTGPNAPRMVLSGMSPEERQRVGAMVRALGGRVQAHVTRKTTHVLLGACTAHSTGVSGLSIKPTNLDNTGISTISRPAESHRDVTGVSTRVCIPTQDDPAGVAVGGGGTAGTLSVATNYNYVEASPCRGSVGVKMRTANALLGAARGVRVLHARWARHSHAAGHWLHHQPYEVTHLAKISQKARAERKALGLMRAEYAYDVFCGMRVRVAHTSPQRAPAQQLLALCGAVLDDQAPDVTVGADAGQLAPKWVFDSVAAGRMRTTRRYVNHHNASFAQTLMPC